MLINWELQMKWVYERLPISPRDDILATEAARQFCSRHYNLIRDALERLRKLLENRNVFIFGAGPSLEVAMIEMKPFFKKKSHHAILVAVNGVTEALLENDLIPHVVVTDLDGKVDVQIRALEEGAMMLLHWHGDNYQRIENIASELIHKGMVIPTVQLEGSSCAPNFGGFTDGDRAVSVACYHSAQKIILVGFDFGEFVGKYSKPSSVGVQKVTRFKKIKLEIAKEIIESLTSKNDIYQYFPENLENIVIEPIQGVKKITLPLLLSLVQ